MRGWKQLKKKPNKQNVFHKVNFPNTADDFSESRYGALSPPSRLPISTQQKQSPVKITPFGVDIEDVTPCILANVWNVKFAELFQLPSGVILTPFDVVISNTTTSGVIFKLWWLTSFC